MWKNLLTQREFTRRKQRKSNIAPAAQHVFIDLDYRYWMTDVGTKKKKKIEIYNGVALNLVS